MLKHLRPALVMISKLIEPRGSALEERAARLDPGGASDPRSAA